MKKLLVSDITLKAIGEQGLFMPFREKLALVEKIDSLLVDVIELPLLSNTKENHLILRTLAGAVKNATVKIPVGTTTDAIDFAFDCVKQAKSPCLQIVLPISTAQMEYLFHLKAPAMLEKIVELVSYAKTKTDNVEFLAQDVFRAEEGFLAECAKCAYQAGAKTIGIYDQAGIAFPEDYATVIEQIKNVCDARVCVMPSDKLKLSASCAVKAIMAGADGVKTSIVGEYLSLTVLADIIRLKKYQLDTEISADITNIATVSASINGITDDLKEEKVNVFAGKIDQNATVSQISEMVKQLGYELSDTDLGKVYDEFKRVTGRKESIDSKELEAIIASMAMQVPSTYHLVNYVVNSGNIIPATANVTLEKNGEKFTGVSTGDGPIDAAFHAIEQVIGHHYELDDFQVHAVTKGRGAVGSSIIRLRADGKLYPGNGVSTDIVGACIRAYINALNKIVYEEN